MLTSKTKSCVFNTSMHKNTIYETINENGGEQIIAGKSLKEDFNFEIL